MGEFVITGPDGKKYRVKGATAEGALAALKKHIGAPAQQTAPQAAVPPRVEDQAQPAPKPTQSEFSRGLSDADRTSLDTAGNPYAQEDTVYDPMTGMPISGGFQNVASTTPMSALKGAAHGLGNAMTFGFGQEIDSALRAAVDPERTYSDYMAPWAQEEADAKASGGYGVGSVAGSLAPGAVAGRIISAAPTTGSAILRSIGLGAAGGGVTGAGSAPKGERLQEGAKGALIGGGIGAAVPAIGGLIRMGTDALRGGVAGLSSRATGALTDTAQSSNRIKDIAAELERLGPEATLADIPGPLQAQAMRLAAREGEGGQQLATSLMARAEGAGPRIQSVMDEKITGPNAAFDLRRQLATERTNTLGPEYEAALKSGGRFEGGAIADTLPQGAVGGVRSTVGQIAKDVGLPRNYTGAAVLPGKPIEATTLHSVRSQLSDDLAAAGREGRGGFIAALKPALTRIDELLDTLPGYSAARTGYANNKAMERAVEEGQAALRGGRATASSPAEFQVAFDKMSDAQKDAFRSGMRRDVAALMGTARNDAAAAWGEFAKEWNAEKLKIALGAEDAKAVIQRLEAEKAFAETTRRVTGGSDTAFRMAADKGLDKADPAGGVMSSNLLAMGPRAIDKYVVDPLILGPRRSALNKEIGKALSATGGDAKALIAELLGRQQPSRAVERITQSLLMGQAQGQTQ